MNNSDSLDVPGYSVVIQHIVDSLICLVHVSVQWHWPGAVRAPPLSRLWGLAALPGLPEHAAGPGRPLGPPGLSPWSPGGAAPDGHQQCLLGRGCSAGGQTQVGHEIQSLLLHTAELPCRVWDFKTGRIQCILGEGTSACLQLSKSHWIFH